MMHPSNEAAARRAKQRIDDDLKQRMFRPGEFKNRDVELIAVEYEPLFRELVSLLQCHPKQGDTIHDFGVRLAVLRNMMAKMEETKP